MRRNESGDIVRDAELAEWRPTREDDVNEHNDARGRNEDKDIVRGVIWALVKQFERNVPGSKSETV